MEDGPPTLRQPEVRPRGADRQVGDGHDRVDDGHDEPEHGSCFGWPGLSHEGCGCADLRRSKGRAASSCRVRPKYGKQTTYDGVGDPASCDGVLAASRGVGR